MVDEVTDDVVGPRWQTSIRTLKEAFSHICETKEFSDVRFTVGTRTFKGHRIVLAARSPAFDRMFGERTLLPVTNIEIHDVPEEAFDVIINFIYKDTIPEIDSLDLAVPIYLGALKYGQRKLAEHCCQLIRNWELTPENVLPVLQMSHLPMLKLKCWRYLKGHYKEVLLTDSVLEATGTTIRHLFEIGIAKKFTKLEALDIVVRWASGKNFQENNDYTTAREQLLMPLAGFKSKCLMQLLGFESFTTDELGQVIIKYPKLLTANEVMMFFVYACASGDKKPDLPDWCSNVIEDEEPVPVYKKIY